MRTARNRFADLDLNVAVSLPLTSSCVTTLEAVHEMNRHRVGCMLVIDDENLVGIFTERGLLQRVVAGGLSPESTTLRSYIPAAIHDLVSERKVIYSGENLSTTLTMLDY